jgi:tRNA A37 threonylcarbamoyladenosine synthetase subunit TsaC/SUA5/YrdC
MAQFIKIYENKPNGRNRKVVKVLKEVGVIYPRYRLWFGCDITNTKALERIAKIKGIKLEKLIFPLFV